MQEADGPWRLDRLAVERLGLPSRSAARRGIERGRVLLNGAPCEPSRFVRPGDRVELLDAPEPPRIIELPLELLHVDPHLALVLKPPGLDTSGRGRTLEAALPPHLPPSGVDGAFPWPRCAHRLDRRTGGLVLVARSRPAAAALSAAFAERRIHKRYVALVAGRLHGEGRTDAEIDGRPAATRWRAVEHQRSLHTGWVTRVEAWPETGRKHQLRAHLAGLGHPILGDDRYPDGPVLRSQGLFLFAAELGLDHPIDGRPLQVRAPVPAKFASFLAREARRWAASQARR